MTGESETATSASVSAESLSDYSKFTHTIQHAWCIVPLNTFWYRPNALLLACIMNDIIYIYTWFCGSYCYTFSYRLWAHWWIPAAPCNAARIKNRVTYRPGVTAGYSWSNNTSTRWMHRKETATDPGWVRKAGQYCTCCETFAECQWHCSRYWKRYQRTGRSPYGITTKCLPCDKFWWQEEQLWEAESGNDGESPRIWHAWLRDFKQGHRGTTT